MEFRVLGPLEVRLDGESVALGGGKQRAVLAALLLRAGEVVPVERLVDEVWGDDPPPSAAHTLESYVSRLRQLFNGHGPVLVRRGAGYAIDLGGASLDARDFVELQERAALAAAVDGHADVIEIAKAALAMWRGPALADVALASAGRAEAERLEELRLRTYELRFGAELALSRHEEAVGELQALAAQNPYRERFVAQLMLALYRCGRHADALDVYERTRAALDDDLGLQPSTELQQLSGQVVRQDPHLRSAAPVVHEPPRHRAQRSRRVATLVAGGVAAAAVMTLTASGSTTSLVDPTSGVVDLSARRVALVLPRDPAGANVRDPSVHYSALGFHNTTTAWGQDTETFVIDESTDAQDAASRAGDVVEGDFDLVVVVGDGLGAHAIAALVRGSAETRFAFVGARLADLGIAKAPNAVGYSFADHEAAQLAGYLSGLVEPRRDPALRKRPDMVSVVAAPRTPHAQRVVAGFVKGARRASPNLEIRVDYVRDASDRTACEAVANRQIEAGSDVVLVVGAPCSSGALATVRVHGVWAVQLEDERNQLGDHVLARLTRWWEGAVALPIDELELVGIFPGGSDLVLGLADDYSVMVEAENPFVSESLWSKVVELCSRIRLHTVDDT
jgi:DNA-binding SARP family transcriptional activator/basic membrane lipoprotein Med (substrate-binding protein (PBP1-ABC) superfamily)